MHWYVIIARMTTSLLPDFRLDGKVALVTGASSGIGSRLAEGFAAAGATVVLAARREDRLQELAERIRAGGAGIPAFYTKTGVGTVVADGKPVEAFEGEDYVRETWLRADLSIIKAWRADTAGNLMFRKTARNFNAPMATAGKITVVEAEEIVEPGTFDPDAIHVPGIYVNRIVKSTINEKRIEKLTVRERA